MLDNTSNNLNSYKQEGLIKNASSVIGDLNNLKDVIFDKIEKVKQLSITIHSKIEEKHEIYNGLDLKKCLEGTVNYVFLLEKVCAALSIEIENLESAINTTKNNPENSTIFLELLEKISLAKRTLKNVKKDILISFSRYEHFFGIQR